MRDMIESEGFGKDDMKVLMDDDNHTPPTRASIIDAIQWLVEGAKAGDSLFLHYSGQGSQVRDENGDERDGLDETLLPVDYASAGQIRDDELSTRCARSCPRVRTL